MIEKVVCKSSKYPIPDKIWLELICYQINLEYLSEENLLSFSANPRDQFELGRLISVTSSASTERLVEAGIIEILWALGDCLRTYRKELDIYPSSSFLLFEVSPVKDGKRKYSRNSTLTVKPTTTSNNPLMSLTSTYRTSGGGIKSVLAGVFLSEGSFRIQLVRWWHSSRGKYDSMVLSTNDCWRFMNSGKDIKDMPVKHLPSFSQCSLSACLRTSFLPLHTS